LKSGAAKGTYPFPPNSGICNDIAIASDGSAYVSESLGGRIHRLKLGASQLEVWASDQRLAVIDGLSFLAGGSVYANNFTTGKLLRVPVNADGSAGAIQPIETSIPLVRPDGLRTVGPRTLIQAEGQGRVTELTINGDPAELRVLKDGLPSRSMRTVVRRVKASGGAQLAHPSFCRCATASGMCTSAQSQQGHERQAKTGAQTIQDDIVDVRSSIAPPDSRKKLNELDADRNSDSDS
jgi:hypothetical protein